MSFVEYKKIQAALLKKETHNSAKVGTIVCLLCGTVYFLALGGPSNFSHFR